MATSQPTRDLFDSIAAEYSSISSDEYDTFIGLAAEELDAQRWGTHYDQAAVLLAAHKLKMRDRAQNSAGNTVGGAAGPVQSVSEGDQSVSYDTGSVGGAASTVGDSVLASTSYGQQYLALRNRTIGGPYVQGD